MIRNKGVWFGLVVFLLLSGIASPTFAKGKKLLSEEDLKEIKAQHLGSYFGGSQLVSFGQYEGDNANLKGLIGQAYAVTVKKGESCSSTETKKVVLLDDVSNGLPGCGGTYEPLSGDTFTGYSNSEISGSILGAISSIPTSLNAKRKLAEEFKISVVGSAEDSSKKDFLSHCVDGEKARTVLFSLSENSVKDGRSVCKVNVVTRVIKKQIKRSLAQEKRFGGSVAFISGESYSSFKFAQTDTYFDLSGPKLFVSKKRACSAKDAESCYMLGIDPREGERRISYLKKACEYEHHWGCLTVGTWYVNENQGTYKRGEGPVSKLKSKCVDDGDAVSCVYAGHVYNLYSGSTRKEAVDYFARACSLGRQQGCFYVAYMTFYGRGVSEDKEEGTKLFQKACKVHGHERSCQELKGICEHKGICL